MAGGCNKCGAKTTPDGDRLMKCPGECKAMYCSKECQRADWTSHKRTCVSLFQSNKCWICKQSSKEGSPLYRACACRGDKGFGHLECFVRHAKINPRAFLVCPLCGSIFRDEIKEALLKESEQQLSQAEAFHSHHGDSDRQMACKLQRGKELITSGHQHRGEALECFEEVYEHYRVKYGEEDILVHKVAADAALGIATGKATMGCYDEALELLTRVERVMHTGRISTDWKEELESRIDAAFASIYTSLERYADALPYSERAFERYEREPDVRIDTKIVAAYRLTDIYVQLHDFEKALHFGTKAYKLLKKAFGPNEPTTKVAKERLELIKECVSRMKQG